MLVDLSPETLHRHIPGLPDRAIGIYRASAQRLEGTPLALILRFRPHGPLSKLLAPYPDDLQELAWAAVAAWTAQLALPQLEAQITASGIHLSETETLHPASEPSLARLRNVFSLRAYDALGALHCALNGRGEDLAPHYPGAFRTEGMVDRLCNDPFGMPRSVIAGPGPKPRQYAVCARLYYEHIDTIRSIEDELAGRWLGPDFHRECCRHIAWAGEGRMPPEFAAQHWLRDFRHAVYFALYGAIRRGEAAGVTRISEVSAAVVPANIRRHVTHRAFTQWLEHRQGRRDRYRGTTGGGGFFA